jgi:two-component system chemotaxis response regulator CheB
VKYRCHLGHSFTEDSLGAEQERDLEAALWTALRALEESAALKRRMAKRSQRWGGLADNYAAQAEQAERRAELLRNVLLGERAKADEGATRTAAEASTRRNAQPRRSGSRRKRSA